MTKTEEAIADDELRDMELMAASIAKDDGTYNAGWFVANSVPRLIAALRASRADRDVPMSEAFNTSGAVFMVDQVNFRCIDIIGTLTPLYECNVCTSVITDPTRHLRETTCDSRVVRNGPASDRLGESWRG